MKVIKAIQRTNIMLQVENENTLSELYEVITKQEEDFILKIGDYSEVIITRDFVSLVKSGAVKLCAGKEKEMN